MKPRLGGYPEIYEKGITNKECCGAKQGAKRVFLLFRVKNDEKSVENRRKSMKIGQIRCFRGQISRFLDGSGRISNSLVLHLAKYITRL